MTSEWRKQQDAERIAASQFKEGIDVALVNHHWDRRIVGKRTVLKVYKTGNFTISGVPGMVYGGGTHEQQWRPSQDGTTAHKAGPRSGFREPTHLEPWSPAIEAEIAELKAQRRRERRLAKIVEILGRRDAVKVVTDAQVAALEQALGLTEDSPSSNDSMDNTD